MFLKQNGKHFMLKKVNLSHIVIVILIILNGFLLFDRTNTHKYLIDLNEKYFEASNRNISFINEFNYIDDKDSVSKIIYKLLSLETSFLESTVVFIFTDLDCANCLAQEVLKLNEIFRQKTYNVVGLYSQKGQTKLQEIVDRYAINFPIKDLGLFKNTFIQYNMKRTPVILLYNMQKMTIIDAYQPIPNDLSYRDDFYKRLINFTRLFNDKLN